MNGIKEKMQDYAPRLRRRQRKLRSRLRLDGSISIPKKRRKRDDEEGFDYYSEMVSDEYY
jgi:hypothetical protein